MAKPLCFVLMPFGKKPGAGGAVIDFDAVYHQLIKPAVEAAGLDAVARRRGAGRRDHPQADVRAADPVRLRGRRSHHRQRQRVLRARRAPRREAGDDGAAVRRRWNPAAVRSRAAAHAALPARPRREARRCGGRRREPQEAARRGQEGRRRQPGLSTGRGIPRHPSTTRPTFSANRWNIRRGVKDQLAAARKLKGDSASPRSARSSKASARSIAPRPESWSTCCCPTAPRARGRRWSRLAGAMPAPLRRSTAGTGAARLRAQPRR